MLKSREVYSESFASKVAGMAARAIAPELMNIKDKYAATIKKVSRAFNEPKAALKDLFESNPDTFRNCKLIKLVEDSAAGVIPEAAAPYLGPGNFPAPGRQMGRLPVPPPARPMAVIPVNNPPVNNPPATNSPKNKKYKGSYKAIFEGSVKEGNDANSPLQYSKNFSVTIKPNNPRNDGDIKYVADTVIFKDDVKFTQLDDSNSNTNDEAYKVLFTSEVLKNKFKLNSKPNFNSLGDIKKGDPLKGFRLNFDGQVIFPSKTRVVGDDEYIIVTDNNGKLQSSGELYKGMGMTLMTNSVNINYSQKNLIIESKKLVDLFCK